MFILLSFILSLTIVSSLTTQTASAADGDYAYSASAKQALAYINKIREEAGLAKVELDPYLTKAAENHANYLTLNSIMSHEEVQGKKGFTGVSNKDRILKVGGADHEYKMVGEGVTYNFNTPEKALAWLFNAPYHRTFLIDPSLEKVGAALNGKYFSISYSAETYERDLSSAIYPFNGQKNVDPVFFGNEIPDPLEGTGIKQSGYIISHTSYDGETVKTATLKDDKGTDIPVVIKNKKRAVEGWYFNIVIPKIPLKEGTTYTVTINGKASTFTTAGTTPTTPPPTSGGSGVSGNYSGTNVGIKLNDSFISVNPTAKVVNGSTFIPLRGVLENMGAVLKWDGKTQTVTITKGATNIKLVIGSKTVHVNGKAQALSVAPFLEKGYTFVPLRFISETFGAKVSWNAKEYIASIDTK